MNPKASYNLMSIIVTLIAIYFAVHWFGWHLLLVLMLFAWGVNLGNDAEKM